MKSRWFDKKEQALKLRKEGGYSIGYIEKKLGIPRSTLSGWFKYIILSYRQKKVLEKNWKTGSLKGRKKALIWHNEQKRNRLRAASNQAEDILSKIDFRDKVVLDVALAMLYLGEGFKKAKTGMGNSDPLILKFFLSVLEKNYQIDRKKVRCELHLRADQNSESLRKFWSKELSVPLERFVSVSFDKRTEGRPSYDAYKGVCIVDCGNIAIQRKLIYLSRRFCEKVV